MVVSDEISSFHVEETKQPVSVAFRDLSFHVQVKDPSAPSPGLCGSVPMTTKRILHGLNGVFQQGRLTAIMGASGAGKTTMLK